jgi:hypothetical protein
MRACTLQQCKSANGADADDAIRRCATSDLRVYGCAAQEEAKQAALIGDYMQAPLRSLQDGLSTLSTSAVRVEYPDY